MRTAPSCCDGMDHEMQILILSKYIIKGEGYLSSYALFSCFNYSFLSLSLSPNILFAKGREQLT